VRKTKWIKKHKRYDDSAWTDCVLSCYQKILNGDAKSTYTPERIKTSLYIGYVVLF
jgi:hypothetical protein